MHGPTSWGDEEPCLGGGRCRKSGPPATHYHTSWAQWAVELMSCTASLPWGQWAGQCLPYTATLPGGSGQWNSCNALPHRLGAVGSGTLAMCGPTHCGERIPAQEAVAA